MRRYTVAELIRERIARQGPITFADYMELCLYAPEVGYYTSGRPRVGATTGDFVTSPAIHPAFGALLCLALEGMWRALGRPSRFAVVEMGAGDGRLAQDIMAYAPHLEPGFGAALDYIAVERGIAGHSAPPFDRLRAAPLHWLSSLDELPGLVVGCFLSNELVDSFPAHRVVVRGGRLREVYVVLEGERLVEEEGEPSTPELAAYFDGLGIALAEGQRAEVNLKMRDWLAQVSHHLGRGFVLTIDVGHPAAELYSAHHHQGTLLGYHRHLATEDPYLQPGDQDLIAQVDFTTLAVVGEKHGLRTGPWLRQRQFLLDLGLGGFLEGLSRLGLAQEELYANRLAMLELIREEGLGGFGVLLQARGVEMPSLTGGIASREPPLSPGERVRVRGELLPSATLPVPLLGPEHVPLMLSRYPDYGFDAAALW